MHLHFFQLESSSLCSLLKRLSSFRLPGDQSLFFHNNASSHCYETCPERFIGSGHVGNTQLGISTQCDLLTRLGSFRSPLVCIDGSRNCQVTLWFVRRCEKMARRMVRSKRGRFLLMLYSQITRKMRKMYNKRWKILWIKHLLLFFQFNVFL